MFQSLSWNSTLFSVVGEKHGHSQSDWLRGAPVVSTAARHCRLGQEPAGEFTQLRHCTICLNDMHVYCARAQRIEYQMRVVRMPCLSLFSRVNYCNEVLYRWFDQQGLLKPWLVRKICQAIAANRFHCWMRNIFWGHENASWSWS